MIIYSGNKTKFMTEVESGNIARIISDSILKKMHRKTGQAEYRSWENSLSYMYMVLNDNKIPDKSGIAIEYNLPNTSKRVDFLISGYDSNDRSNVIIVELKQWQELKKVEGLDGLVETYIGGSNRRTVHPSYQAWSYAQIIRDYNEYAQLKNILLWPCACLHNYLRRPNDPLDDPIYQAYLDNAPAFTKSDTYELRNYIKSAVKKGDQGEILYEIDNGRIKPSKSLQDAIVGMLENNPEFNLIDDQKVVFERIMELSRKCEKDNKKRVFVAIGGPGTGKSVIAINLLARLTQEEVFAQYCSKNSAPREVYKKKLKGHIKISSIDSMFKSSGVYMGVNEDTSKNNAIGVILADEAHRLNKKSGFYGSEGENQISEIIQSARLSVFFIDESQRVTVDDIGSVSEIEYWAAKHKAKVYKEELNSQFRCNGSDGYLAWLDDVLEIRKTANYSMEGINYEFISFDSPHEMQEKVIERNKTTNKSRILAGYCWDWPKASRKDTNFHNIKIEDFEISWNLEDSEAFAISPTSINEAGCIHTTQGLEFEYVGVIIGNDLRYENGRLVTDFTKRSKTDRSIKGLKKMSKTNPQRAQKIADEIIKNSYRTLMTRGMKGCYVYATDPGLRQYLKKRSCAVYEYNSLPI